MKIRSALIDELPALSELCLRSKAYWKYDAAFIAACREELTLTPHQLDQDFIMVADDDGRLAGVVQLVLDGTTAELEKLFIDPDWIGKGVGRQLFIWAVETAKSEGATIINVVADPGAAPFYEKMGFKQFGAYPSGSVSGRELPHMRLRLEQ
ncbi:GNAT family N-acetyltransferase [Maritalea sp.]|uniref:GNAT family N-acetyltransferase n=1 Tax=Maritalea sp. TaxID=2003361 RepID=UPI003EF83792